MKPEEPKLPGIPCQCGMGRDTDGDGDYAACMALMRRAGVDPKRYKVVANPGWPVPKLVLR